MTDSSSAKPRRSILSWIRDLFRPSRPPSIRQTREVQREKVRVQIDVIRRAFDDPVKVASASGDDADAEYLFHPERVLVRSGDDVERVRQFFLDRDAIYRGTGDSMEVVRGHLAAYLLPPRDDDGTIDVLAILDELDRELGEGVATPDHVLYVTGKGIGGVCPAIEPELVPDTARPMPALNQDLGAGDKVKVSVVDTGWYAKAASHPATKKFLNGVQGDAEQVNQADIHEYAGHGTFVSGIIRCLAPSTQIEVEGFLPKGGAAWESEITSQLNEAMKENDSDIISISAGTHTRNNIGLLGFQVLAMLNKWEEGDSSVLVVAAAGNDSSDVQFWPAAFDWVVGVGSLDADGTVSDYSNYGKWVNVYAQGSNLINAFPTGTYVTYEPQTPKDEVRTFKNGLARWSGTSFSTPVVTGAIAAYKTRHQKTNVREAYAEMLKHAQTNATSDPKYGAVTMLVRPFI